MENDDEEVMKLTQDLFSFQYYENEKVEVNLHELKYRFFFLDNL